MFVSNDLISLEKSYIPRRSRNPVVVSAKCKSFIPFGLSRVLTIDIKDYYDHPSDSRRCCSTHSKTIKLSFRQFWHKGYSQ